MSRRDDKIDGDPTVQAAAKALRIRSNRGLMDAITRASEAQVAGWIDDLGEELTDLDDVHRLVLNGCGIRVERIRGDEDIARIEDRYKRRALPVQLEFEFSRDTEALVFRNAEADAKSSSKYVAVVDARGDRAARAWFAERHEPSHILCKDPGASAVSRRTPLRRAEPIEQVVDAVAAAIGFWEPIVKPVLTEELARRSDILDAFDQARQRLAPEASVECCYRAFVRLCDFPLVVLRSSQATRRDGTSRALRATTIIHNQRAAAIGLQVPHNYRIPADSIITHVHDGYFLGARTEVDDLRRWKDSTGKALPPCRVSVTARGSWSALVPM